MGTAQGTEGPRSTSTRGDPTAGASGPREPVGVYRRGDTVWRVSETVEGGLKVETLTDGAWVAGPVNLVGLRLDSGTTKLNQASIDALPA
jgi:hypothetical protein